MSRKYTKGGQSAENVRGRNAKGETDREIADLPRDQEAQYTVKTCFDMTQEHHASPSMFSAGDPSGNAAMETFFSTLKTNRLYRAHFSTCDEAAQFAAVYVNFDNGERILLKNSLTPVAFRCKAM